MNLVQVILDRVTGEGAAKIGALVGMTETQVRDVLKGGVPALLSALASMAMGGGSGAEKIAAAVKRFDPSSSGHAADPLGGDPKQAMEQGQDLLGSLLGSGGLSGLTGVLSKFGGLDQGIVKKLLAYVSPLIMGTIAKQFQGKPITPQGLTNLFAEQQANIADALPTGLSLSSIPGLANVRDAASNVTAAAQKTAGAAQDAGSQFMKALLPVAALALLAFVGWQFLQKQKPEVAPNNNTVVQHSAQKPIEEPADVTRASQELAAVSADVTRTLSGIKDAADAEAALPELTKINLRFDSLAGLWRNIPQAARMTLTKTLSSNFGKIKELADRVLAIPGVGEKLQPVINDMLSKLQGLQRDA